MVWDYMQLQTLKLPQGPDQVLLLWERLFVFNELTLKTIFFCFYHVR